MQEMTELMVYKLKNRMGRLYGNLRNLDKTGNPDIMKQMRLLINEIDKLLIKMINLETQTTLPAPAEQPAGV